MQHDWSEYLKILQTKWGTVPGGDVRINTNVLAKMSDLELLNFWIKTRHEASEDENFSVRGWYHTLYAPILTQKRVLDVGCGLGIDGITFAQKGAKVTFLDIIESNVRLVERLCRLQNVTGVDFCYLENDNSLNSIGHYDFIWCQGSMINTPFDIAKSEAHELLKHLKKDGRWIELAYPKTRWEREGRLSFEKWGDKTDGGAPWMEWYDLEKIINRLSPAICVPVLNFEFHNSDFIWFDLLKKD